MTAEALLSRVEKPKRTGPESWLCRCPAHADKSPSLAIRELPDGRVLLHCFAGCDVAAVLEAVGLDFDALFPPKPLGDHLAPLRRPFPAADVLEAILGDALVLQQIANDVQRTGELAVSQRALLQCAIARVAAARDMING